MLVGDFIAAFPEFTDSNKFPVSTINFYLDIINNTLDPNVWNQYYNLGLGLYVAHHVSLESKAKRESEFGGNVGINTGPVAGKSIGGIQQGFDTSAVINPGDGHWNYTQYGIRFMSLCKLVGAGCIQL